MKDYLNELKEREAKLLDKMKVNVSNIDLYEELRNVQLLIHAIRFAVRYGITSRFITPENLHIFTEEFENGKPSFGEDIAFCLRVLDGVKDEEEKEKVYKYIDDRAS